MRVNSRWPNAAFVLALFLVGSALLSGCGRREDTTPRQPLSHDGKPLTNNLKGAPLPQVKLQVGQECTQFEGNAACESDLCLRVAPGIPPKGFCSIRCNAGDDSNCPDAPSQFRCAQVFPSDNGWLCVPPSSHLSAVETLRGVKVPLPVPRAGPELPPDGGLARP
jgi:hypothetical protein